MSERVGGLVVTDDHGKVVWSYTDEEARHFGRLLAWVGFGAPCGRDWSANEVQNATAAGMVGGEDLV